MTHEEILTTLGHYVDYLIAGSTAEAPLWNIEKVRSGKPNKWNYIDGCMITACLSLYKTTGTYTIGSDVDKLTGVYNINKGYAVFKQIDILAQNNKYTIVDTGTSYGVALYDHIALDGSKIKENQLVVK